MIIALPEEYQYLKPDEVLKKFTDYFKEKYGVECISALHYNKRQTNYHIHLIFSERKELPEPIVKIAARNMFYDETGKHRRTKKEILDADGNVRKGCYIVPKGEPYSGHYFQPKNQYFKSKAFLQELKQLKAMLDREMGIYLGGSLVIALVFGSILSVIVCRRLDAVNHCITLVLPWLFLLALVVVLAVIYLIFTAYAKSELKKTSILSAIREE